MTIKELIEKRINLLKAMHENIIAKGDDFIYDIWIRDGVPDEPDDEIFEFIASNDDEWCEVCKLFGELITID